MCNSILTLSKCTLINPFNIYCTIFSTAYSEPHCCPDFDTGEMLQCNYGDTFEKFKGGMFYEKKQRYHFKSDHDGGYAFQPDDGFRFGKGKGENHAEKSACIFGRSLC